jgi:gas vesicle protein
MVTRDLLEDAAREKRKKEGIQFIQQVAVGMNTLAVAGVATGILIAPKSGKATLEDLMITAVKTVENTKNTVREKVEEMKGSAIRVEKKVDNVIKVVHKKRKT